MNWVAYAVLSAFFASLVAIFGKIGIKGIDSNLAVALRTIVIVVFEKDFKNCATEHSNLKSFI